MSKRTLLIAASLLLLTGNALGDWMDKGDTFRRPIEVSADADDVRAGSLVTVEFFTAGHHLPGGADIRVATPDGHVLPSHILQLGPGDHVSLVFAAFPGSTHYEVYFGNAKPTTRPDSNDFVFSRGLLLEMHSWNGVANANADQIARAFARGKLIGQAMIDRPFLGLNPFGDSGQWISRVSGSLSAPVDGDYAFAGAAQSRGALLIDSRQVLYVPSATSDSRFNATVHLSRGRHDFVFYDANVGGDGWFSLCWRRPDMAKYDVVNAEAFGVLARGTAGPLEQFGKNFTADFTADYQAEAFVGGAYSHRIKFTAHPLEGATFDWDFGDGIRARGPSVEHVYLAPGEYAVKLAAREGTSSDTQITKMRISRDFAHLDHVAQDVPGVQEKIIDTYDFTMLASNCLGQAVMVAEAADEEGTLTKAASAMARLKHVDDPSAGLVALQHASAYLQSKKKIDDAIAVLALVPVSSNLQPAAASQQARLLLWWKGDVDAAAKVMAPYSHSSSNDAQQLWAQTQVLIGNASVAQSVFDHFQQQEERNSAKLAAVSGAMARTIEFRLRQKDWANGEDDWEKWQKRCPGVFIEGYSVLLRTRLMEAKGAQAAAAKIAEAFARAVPQSPYAPQLLWNASKLLASTDTDKSRQLRDLLKQRYPEDPLSQ